MRFLLNLWLAMKLNKVKRSVFWPFWHFPSQFDTDRACTYTREICTSPIFKTKSRKSGWSSYLTFQIETRRLWLLSLKFFSDQTMIGVESNWNSFEIRSIRKFAIRLIWKGKKYSKNSMKINSKFVQFDSTTTIGWSQIFQMLDSFEICSIRFWKFMIWLIRKGKNIWKIRWKLIRNSFDSIRLQL